MQKISGYLILVSFLLTLYSYFFEQSFILISSLPLWVSVVLLFASLPNKKLLYILLFLSVGLLGIALMQGYEIKLVKLFSINQYLIVLLIGVGFLRLIATPKNEESAIKKGKSSFIKTYISLHLFASVINLSALLLVADKFYQKAKKITPLQYILLTRAFGSDAYWSPFFVAFGAALTFTPNVNLFHVITSGLFMASAVFVITYLDIRNDKNLFLFEGYPLSYSNLLLPLSLAAFVLLMHYYYPDIKIIILIALFSIIAAVLVLVLKKGSRRGVGDFFSYITKDLPQMKTEISLFLIAGLFGVSVSTILRGIGFDFPFEYYDYKVAALVLFVFIFLSMIGVHVIISISIFGHMLQGFDHTLVAITFLMAWAIGVACSPFSGVNLALQARYGVSTREVLKLNFGFLLKVYTLCVVLLYFLSNSLHVKLL